MESCGEFDKLEEEREARERRKRAAEEERRRKETKLAYDDEDDDLELLASRIPDHAEQVTFIGVIAELMVSSRAGLPYGLDGFSPGPRAVREKNKKRERKRKKRERKKEIEKERKKEKERRNITVPKTIIV